MEHSAARVDMLEHTIRQPKTRTKETPLLLQHGAWHGAWCWENWLRYFCDLGYEVHAYSLPGHSESSPLNRHINRYSLDDYAGHLAEVVERISPTPAIIGHSVGGGITQRYLEAHKVPAVVLLATMPQQGLFSVMLRWLRRNTIDTLKSAVTLNTHHIVNSPEKVADAFFASGAFLDLEAEVDTSIWEQQFVRESWLMFLTSLFPITDPAKVRGTPMFVIAGGLDAIVSVEEERRTAQVYEADFQVFPDQAHNMMADARWREIADIIDRWFTQTAKLD